MAGHEIVDLALSDDEESPTLAAAVRLPDACGAISTTSQEIDLTDDLVQITSLSPSTSIQGIHAQSGAPPNATSSSFTPTLSDEAPATPVTQPQSSGTRRRQSRCLSCLKEDVPRLQTFCLDTCGHRLCPACVASYICVPSERFLDSDSRFPFCPVPDCTKPVSVRDLALILQEQSWAALQCNRLAAFRSLARKEVRCLGCSSAGISSSLGAGDSGNGSVSGKVAHSDPDSLVLAQSVGAGDERGGGGHVPTRQAFSQGVIVTRSKQKRKDDLNGTAEQRAKALLDIPLVVCTSCSARMCRFCGEKMRMREYAHAPCGGSALCSASGLLQLMAELLENPSDEQLTGPAVPVWNRATDGAGGRGRGRGRGGARGRGRGRGGSWKPFHGVLGSVYVDSENAPKGISPKWSKGTGYGGGGNDAASAASQAVAHEAERRADRAMVAILKALISCLPMPSDFPDDLPALLALVRESPLLQTVCAYLRNDSLMDIAQRSDLYLTIFELVLAFARHELLAPLVDSVPPKAGGASSKADSESLATAVAGAKGKGKGRAPSYNNTENIQGGRQSGGAQHADGDQGPDEDTEDVEEAQEVEQVEEVSVADLLASTNRQAKVFAHAPGAEEGDGAGEAGTLAFALQVTEVHDKVKASLGDLRSLAEVRVSSPAMQAVLAATGTGGVVGAGLGRKRKREELDCVEISLESRYLADLGDSRFKLINLPNISTCHGGSQAGGHGGRERSIRISREVSSLATSLPVQPESSIFLRVDEDRFDVMRAMITGPKDTPYEGGCFEFDITLPPDYPNRPPHVHFLTTGNGRVRFNPNLYNSGKVCLSLLGTWSGPGWDSKTSTILQVLVSIQSLIFVSEPYFNEPGFEGQLGTQQGKYSSRSYNSRIRNATLLFGVVGALEARTGFMQDVVRTHFRLIKGRMLRTARMWLMESSERPYDARGYLLMNDHGCNGDYPSMAKAVARMEALFAEL